MFSPLLHDHDSDRPPSSQLKLGTGQGKTRAWDTTCLEPSVSFFFCFKFLLLFSLLNVYLSRDQQMVTTITINKTNVVSRCICVLSSSMLLFFCLFFCTKYLFTVRLHVQNGNQDNAWGTWSRYYYEWREKGLRRIMIRLEPEVCFFFLISFYLLH